MRNKSLDDKLVITIGGFDGVHLGHQAIIQEVQNWAKEIGARTGVLTFEPHPAKVLYPDFPYLLTPLLEKRLILIELGVDFVQILNFDERLRNMEPEEFVREMVVRQLQPAAVVIGADHRFGKDARGDIKMLKKILDEYGILLKVVPEVIHLGAPVRSTRIREHLVLGHIQLANELLGRYYAIAGKTIKGTGTGRKLGFPTINIQPVSQDKLLPAEGVYAGVAELGGKRFAGAVNIGFRPTFAFGVKNVEVHLLNFAGEVPEGSEVVVRLIEHLRPEQKFPNPAALKEQIGADIMRVQEVIERERPR